MIKFRWRRCNLEESMATAMEFDDLQALHNYINNYVIEKYSMHFVVDIACNVFKYDLNTNQYLTFVKCDGVIVGFIFEEVNK